MSGLSPPLVLLSLAAVFGAAAAREAALPALAPAALLLLAFLLFARAVASRYVARISPAPAAAATAEHGAAAVAPAATTAAAAAAPPPGGQLTLAQLAAFGGKDPSKPLYLACLGDVYDVSSAAEFYGPDGAYACFAGCEANRALAKMSLKKEDCVADTEGLSLMERDILRDWKAKFDTKYAKVATVKP